MHFGNFQMTAPQLTEIYMYNLAMRGGQDMESLTVGQRGAENRSLALRNMGGG
jgi:hypothetical protein